MGVVMSRDHFVIWFKFQDPNHKSGTAEARILKFLHMLAISSVIKSITYHPLNGHDYVHVTVFKFCHLPWCSASRKSVSDS